MYIRKGILILLLVMGGVTSVLADGPGAYLQVGRSNDPFVFCTYGDPLWGNWAAIDGLLGTWTVLDPDEPYNQEEVDEFMQICPQALGEGAWTGPGTGQETPTLH